MPSDWRSAPGRAGLPLPGSLSVNDCRRRYARRAGWAPVRSLPGDMAGDRPGQVWGGQAGVVEDFCSCAVPEEALGQAEGGYGGVDSVAAELAADRVAEASSFAVVLDDGDQPVLA